MGFNSEKMWEVVDEKKLKGKAAVEYITKLLNTKNGIKRFKSFRGY